MKEIKMRSAIGWITVILLFAALSLLALYLIKLDSVVRTKFEGRRWDIPAKVFARPLELYNGAETSQQETLQELRLLGYKSASDYKKPGTYVQNGGKLFIHTRGFNYGESQDPEQILAIQYTTNRISTIQSTEPNTGGIVQLEPLLIGGIYPQHNEDRVLVKLNQIPDTFIKALVATEDRNFYNHHGISVRGIARALVVNITGKGRQGGSTLTQQLVKNFYLTPERTLRRKANEAMMALLVDMHYDKDEILVAYINEVNLGQSGNYSVNGFGLGAQFYFGLPLKELNLAQQAFLVGLVQGPSLYNPWRNPEKAIKRRNIVLKNMLTMGHINQSEYDNAVNSSLKVIEKPSIGISRFPDFLDLVRRQLRNEYQEADLTNQGLRIFTSLDPLIQIRTQNAFKNSVKRLASSNRAIAALQGASIISRTDNGEIVAAVGSANEFTGFNRTVDAKRQVGSLLKPIIYMNAIESGRYTWASQVEDRKIDMKLKDGGTWSPKNYAGGEHGDVPLFKALANSYNLSAVRLGQEFGLSKFRSTLERLGVESKIPNYPSSFLGAMSLSPMEILSVYQSFASQGRKYPLRSIRSVVAADGKMINRYNAVNSSNVIEPTSAYLINYGMQQVMTQGTGKAAYARLSSALQLAGKSGTTNDARDAWFAGYSGNYVSVVWLGLDNNKPIGLTGSSGALPVWTNVMAQLKLKPVDFVLPSNVQWQWVDIQAQQRSAPNCPNSVSVPMINHTEPENITECALPYYKDPMDDFNSFWGETTDSILQQDSQQSTIDDPFESEATEPKPSVSPTRPKPSDQPARPSPARETTRPAQNPRHEPLVNRLS